MPIVYAAVKALVTDGEKFLLLKQDVGGEIFWDLPGGRVQFGESPVDGLKREGREELGQELQVGRPLGVWWFFRKADGDQVVCTTYLCSVPNPEIVLPAQEGEKISGFVWVAKADLARPEFTSVVPSLRALIESA